MTDFDDINFDHFDTEYYHDNYPDLQKITQDFNRNEKKQFLISHFYHHGFDEGRIYKWTGMGPCRCYPRCPPWNGCKVQSKCDCNKCRDKSSFTNLDQISNSYENKSTNLKKPLQYQEIESYNRTKSNKRRSLHWDPSEFSVESIKPKPLVTINSIKPQSLITQSSIEPLIPKIKCRQCKDTYCTCKLDDKSRIEQILKNFRDKANNQ